jgi:hypothetical protein
MYIMQVSRQLFSCESRYLTLYNKKALQKIAGLNGQVIFWKKIPAPGE